MKKNIETLAQGAAIVRLGDIIRNIDFLTTSRGGRTGLRLTAKEIEELVRAADEAWILEEETSTSSTSG